METKELKITIPENHEIDWQESAKQEKIIFKKKDTKPRSWKEYCGNFKGTFYYISDYEGGIGTSFTSTWIVSKYKNILPSKELAEAFLVMMQLMSLRQAWIGDWRPDWKDHTQFKANILCSGTDFTIAYFKDLNSRPLSFPTQEMAEDFMDCFKDLLNSAKDLL